MSPVRNPLEPAVPLSSRMRVGSQRDTAIANSSSGTNVQELCMYVPRCGVCVLLRYLPK